MPNYIKPTLQFVSNPETSSTDPGPMSFALSLSTTPTADVVSGVYKGRLSVDLVEQRLITTSGTQERIVDGFVLGGATKTVATVGCYLYLKNHSVTTGEHILVGIVSGSRISVAASDNQTTVTGVNNPTAPHEDTEGATLTQLVGGDGGVSNGDSRLTVANNQTLRTFTLMPGEFAFLPFDYTGDIYVQAASGSPKLEFWRFDKA